jgi:hypothetical protein
MGSPLVVTYLPSQPHTYRMGHVDSGRVLRRGAILALFVLRGFAWFGVPFVYLEIQRRRLRQKQWPSGLLVQKQPQATK